MRESSPVYFFPLFFCCQRKMPDQMSRVDWVQSQLRCMCARDAQSRLDLFFLFPSHKVIWLLLISLSCQTQTNHSFRWLLPWNSDCLSHAILFGVCVDFIFFRGGPLWAASDIQPAILYLDTHSSQLENAKRFNNYDKIYTDDDFTRFQAQNERVCIPKSQRVWNCECTKPIKKPLLIWFYLFYAHTHTHMPNTLCTYWYRFQNRKRSDLSINKLVQLPVGLTMAQHIFNNINCHLHRFKSFFPR